MIWALAGRKGAPGATTLAVLLAWCWPAGGEPRVVLEADPDGGVLAARWHAALGLTHEPGLLSLAAAGDATVAGRLARHTQTVLPGVELVAAPPGPPQVVASLHALGDAAAADLTASPRPCFVDCGRLGPASAALPWARRAGRVLLVVRPRLDEVVALRPVAEALVGLELPVGIVCVSDHPFHPLEVAAELELPLLGVIADDPAAAALVYRDGLSGRTLVRSRLVRSVTELATSLAAAAAEPVVTPADEEVDA